MFYGIAPHVYLAEVDGDLVLLDARTNAYLCVPRSFSDGLKVALTGSHRFRPSADLLDELETAGLFGMTDAQPRHAPPRMEAIADLDRLPGARAAATPSRLLALACAAALAPARLRIFRPRRWFATAKRWNARAASGQDVSGVHALARLARDARPFFPGLGSCLPGSLYLLGFLHRQGIAARWVFGVRTYPFEAHCWVEHQGVVLNDSLEHVRWYTPIVAV
ncbi:lasso peptide biosynthesis B2 protein [Sphingomonas sp. DT-207]